eukprot:snap_masked-scaffold_5-processed-gene-1.31-mRNA-1 protein AED:1.00 eAED:1.00 QI:0/0/0/0/1/1/2/0/73
MFFITRRESKMAKDGPTCSYVGIYFFVNSAFDFSRKIVMQELRKMAGITQINTSFCKVNMEKMDNKTNSGGTN